MSQLKGVEISLKPIAGGVNRVLPPGINQIMEQEYASKYLESIGAYPTRENVEFVLNNLGIDEALVLPVWARSKIVIIPGMNNKDGFGLGTSMQDFLSENEKDPAADATPHKRKKKGSSILNDDNEAIEENRMSGPPRSSYTNLVGRRVSWTTVNTLDLVEPLLGVVQKNNRIAETFRLLLRPPHFQTIDIQNALFTFITSLPDYIPRVKHDKTFELFKSVRKLLKSKQCMQLYGLLIHFSYWNIIHPTAHQTIKALREVSSNQEYAAFQDVDLSDQTMMQLRKGAPGRSSLQENSRYVASLRSPLSVERMFMDEVLNCEEDYVEVIHLNADGDVHNSNPILGNLSRSRLSSKSNELSSSNVAGSSSKNIDKAPLLARGLSGISVISTASAGSRAASPVRIEADNISNYSGIMQATKSEDRGDGCAPPSPLRERGVSFQSIIEEVRTPRLENDEGQESVTAGSVETAESLSAYEKEQLFMQLEVCLIDLFQQVGRKRGDLVTGRQAMVTCCHFVVDEILTAAYPWFATLPNTPHELQHTVHTPDYLDYAGHGKNWAGPYVNNIKQLNLRLRRLVHQGMADIIDPSRLYTSSMLLTSVTGRVPSQSMGNKGKSRFYTTSVATKAVLGDSHSVAARKFIQQGKGVYTVLPGVIDSFTCRPSTGQLNKSTKHVALHDNQSWDGSWEDNRNVKEVVEGMGYSVFPAPQSSSQPCTSRESSRPLGQSVDVGVIGRIVNRFPDNHARTRPRPATSSGASTRHRPMTTNCTSQVRRGGSASEAVKSTTKKLDFMNIFADQPDVGYFPVIKANSNDLAIAAHAACARENDWLDEFLPPGSRASTAELEDGGRPNSRNQSRNSIKNFSNSRPGTGSRPDSSAQSQKYGAVMNSVDLLQAGLCSVNSKPNSRPSTSASNRVGMGVAQLESHAQERLEASFAQTMQMYPSGGGSISSSSYLSENRSMVHNKAAAMDLSLRAKASLMELLVDKTASLYKSEIQTNLIKTRIALLKQK